MREKLLLITLFVSLLFGITTLNAKTFRYGQVKSMPLSVEKDYYIWRFLTQKSTSKSQAKAIIGDAKYLNKKLKVAYKKKTGQMQEYQKENPAHREM